MASLATYGFRDSRIYCKNSLVLEPPTPLVRASCSGYNYFNLIKEAHNAYT